MMAAARRRADRQPVRSGPQRAPVPAPQHQQVEQVAELVQERALRVADAGAHPDRARALRVKQPAVRGIAGQRARCTVTLPATVGTSEASAHDCQRPFSGLPPGATSRTPRSAADASVPPAHSSTAVTVARSPHTNAVRIIDRARLPRRPRLASISAAGG
jgi:hypothetical protein